MGPDTSLRPALSPGGRGLGRDADPSDADPLAAAQPSLAGLAADSVRGLAPGGARPARRGDRIDPDDLGLERVAIVYPGAQRFAVADRVEAVPIETLADPGRLFAENRA